MMRFAFFLWLLTLAAGCIVEDKPVTQPGDGGVDAGGDAGIPCGTVICPADRPVCNDELVCVECTADETDHCTERGLICDIGSSSCAECSGDMDCTDPEAARCDEGLCKPCMEDQQCDGVDRVGAEQSACDDGVCVDCTPQTEGTTCVGGMTCHPVTKECTNVRVGSIEVCQECVSDSQCGDDGNASDAHRCVPMSYGPEDNRFPNDQVGFCLKSTEGGCERPYSVTLFDRPSLSDMSIEDDYCGVDEEFVTCPAVRALLSDAQCPDGTDDECPTGGICRDVGSLQDRCTFSCGLPAQCPADPPADTCGSSGGGGDDYCGG